MKKHLGILFVSLGLLASAPASAALQIQSWTQPDGARVLFVTNHAIPMLDVSVQFDAGQRRDPAGRAGLAELTAASLTRGVAGGDGPELSEAQVLDGFADVAAQEQASAGKDRGGAKLRTLSSPSERDKALGLLARMLAHPSFPQAGLDRDKALAISGIREELTKPEAIAEKAFMAAIYGQHPYAPDATEASVQAIGRDDVVAFHRSHYVANRAVITLIGDVTRQQAEQIAAGLTRDLPQGAALPALPPVVAPKGGETRIAHPASQSHILIGAPAIQRGDNDFFALTVGNYILGGGGFVSRLTDEVREKRGLTYSVYSGFSPLAQPGPFQIGLQTKKEQTAEALKVVRATLDKFLQEGPTPAEMKAAKDNLTGGFALRIDSNAKLLENISVVGFYNLPLDYLDRWIDRVREVSVSDVRAAFRKHVHPEQLSTVIVGEDPQSAASATPAAK
ncbi:insulinase family protein [Herbaspirillum sp. LeCh32-8]|uniref:M16 family metallopeptidase n=1 Tax=Herbaspirillum sp. LeCh32-8 TaxID=2821356 RepID=UPI001AE54353|nr:pitrilysin family protein [Herbaspirillum sp. LeCh32-8]MBP0600059.1 insulinase family protein [Herbaspirillum sp. LeCh32-8]